MRFDDLDGVIHDWRYSCESPSLYRINCGVFKQLSLRDPGWIEATSSNDRKTAGLKDDKHNTIAVMEIASLRSQ